MIDKDRRREYEVSYEEASTYPEEINAMNLRLKHRLRRKRRNTCIRIIGCTAALFLLFVGMVNTSTAVAEAIYKIPLLGTLAEYVSFDKSLENAVQNQYAKEVNLVATSNNQSLSLAYVISDSKRLVLFFQLPEKIRKEESVISMQIDKIIDNTTGEEFREFASESPSYLGGIDKDKDELLYISIRSADAPIPQDITLSVALYKDNSNQPSDNTNLYKEIYEPSKPVLTVLGIYEFKLTLGEPPSPKVTTINKDVIIDGQTLRINSVAEYPTGTELSISYSQENRGIINGLEFNAIDNHGEVWGGSGGISAIGPDENGHVLYYLEGDYFKTNSIDKIQITGIRVYDKTEAEITLDLSEKTMTPSIKGMMIKSIEKVEDKAYITFTLESKVAFGFFEQDYKDSQGNTYSFYEQSFSQLESTVENNLSLVWPEDNKLILKRSMSPMIELDKPIEIEID